MALFVPLSDAIGPIAAAFAIVPVCITALAYGFRVAIAAGVFGSAVNALLLLVAGVWGAPREVAVGDLMIVAIGALAGKMSDLSWRQTENTEKLAAAQKELTGVHHEINALVSSAPIGLVLTDAQRMPIRTNPLIDELLGTDAHGKPWEETLSEQAPVEDRQWLIDEILDGHEGATSNGGIEFRVVRDGQERWLKVRFQSYPIGEAAIQGYVGSLADTSAEVEARRVAEERKRLSHDAELIEARHELLSLVANNIRTPLVAIKELTHYLSERPNTAANGERGELLSMIETTANSLSRILDDLLVAAEADVGLVPGGPLAIDIAEEIDTVVRQLDPGAATLVDTRVSSTEAWIHPQRFRQILRKLIDNAIQHGGPHIVIEVGTSDKLAHVFVSDNGPGVPDSERETIFEPYTTSAVHSLGLGLSVARRIARVAGGDVTYRRRGHNTIFELTLRRP